MNSTCETQKGAALFIVTSTTTYPDGDGSFGPDWFIAFWTKEEAESYMAARESREHPNYNVFEDFYLLEGGFPERNISASVADSVQERNAVMAHPVSEKN